MDVRTVLPRDAIPSVDEPTFGPAYDGAPDDTVVVVDPADWVGDGAAGVPRAYPVRYLDFHEIVNDTVDGRPVAVTWCPLCASAVVYDRRVDGEPLTFGVSGKLADDDLVMYDRETGSEWKQSLGRCLAGPHEGRQLSVVPSTVLTAGRFAAAFDGVVLQPPGGESEAASETDEPVAIDYDRAPYAAYFERDGFGLDAHRETGEGRSWERDDLDPKAVVLGVRVGDDALGFPLDRVAAAGGVVRTTVGSEAVVVVVDDGVAGAFFDPGDTADGPRDAADGPAWNPVTGRTAAGRPLDRLPVQRTFAFNWQDDHGPDAFWSPGD